MNDHSLLENIIMHKRERTSAIFPQNKCDNLLEEYTTSLNLCMLLNKHFSANTIYCLAK